jgi:hypothetical protein
MADSKLPRELVELFRRCKGARDASNFYEFLKEASDDDTSNNGKLSEDKAGFETASSEESDIDSERG